MIGRLLIDECLSPELAQLAIDAGHVESTSVRDRGRLGPKDWELMEYVIQEDFILATRNTRDFRGAGKADPGGLHGAAEVRDTLRHRNPVIAYERSAPRGGMTPVVCVRNQPTKIIWFEGNLIGITHVKIVSQSQVLIDASLNTFHGQSKAAFSGVNFNVLAD
jgi:hypothetical protein